jgi:tetratricopeptide (TPR) repeat protein
MVAVVRPGEGRAPRARGARPFRKADYRRGEAIGDPTVETNALSGLGLTHGLAGEHAQAAECYQRALDLVRQLGDLPIQAVFLDRLGDTQHASGDAGAARDAWQRALTILDELDAPEADAVRSKLDAILP